MSQDGNSKSSVRVFSSCVDEEMELERCRFVSVWVSVLDSGLDLAELLSSSTLFLVLSACSSASWFLTLLSIRFPSSFV